MSCIRGLFSRKRLAQSSETILVNEGRGDNTTTRRPSAACASAAQNVDTESSCSDGNVTPSRRSATEGVATGSGNPDPVKAKASTEKARNDHSPTAASVCKIVSPSSVPTVVLSAPSPVTDTSNKQRVTSVRSGSEGCCTAGETSEDKRTGNIVPSTSCTAGAVPVAIKLLARNAVESEDTSTTKPPGSPGQKRALWSPPYTSKPLTCLPKASAKDVYSKVDNLLPHTTKCTQSGLPPVPAYNTCTVASALLAPLYGCENLFDDSLPGSEKGARHADFRRHAQSTTNVRSSVTSAVSLLVKGLSAAVVSKSAGSRDADAPVILVRSKSDVVCSTRSEDPEDPCHKGLTNLLEDKISPDPTLDPPLQPTPELEGKDSASQAAEDITSPALTLDHPSQPSPELEAKDSVSQAAQDITSPALTLNHPSQPSPELEAKNSASQAAEDIRASLDTKFAISGTSPLLNEEDFRSLGRESLGEACEGSRTGTVSQSCVSSCAVTSLNSIRTNHTQYEAEDLLKSSSPSADGSTLVRDDVEAVPELNYNNETAHSELDTSEVKEEKPFLQEVCKLEVCKLDDSSSQSKSSLSVPPFCQDTDSPRPEKKTESEQIIKGSNQNQGTAAESSDTSTNKEDNSVLQQPPPLPFCPGSDPKDDEDLQQLLENALETASGVQRECTSSDKAGTCASEKSTHRFPKVIVVSSGQHSKSSSSPKPKDLQDISQSQNMDSHLTPLESSTGCTPQSDGFQVTNQPVAQPARDGIRGTASAPVSGLQDQRPQIPPRRNRGVQNSDPLIHPETNTREELNATTSHDSLAVFREETEDGSDLLDDLSESFNSIAELESLLPQPSASTKDKPSDSKVSPVVNHTPEDEAADPTASESSHLSAACCAPPKHPITAISQLVHPVNTTPIHHQPQLSEDDLPAEDDSKTNPGKLSDIKQTVSYPHVQTKGTSLPTSSTQGTSKANEHPTSKASSEAKLKSRSQSTKDKQQKPAPVGTPTLNQVRPYVKGQKNSLTSNPEDLLSPTESTLEDSSNDTLKDRKFSDEAESSVTSETCTEPQSRIANAHRTWEPTSDNVGQDSKEREKDGDGVDEDEGEGEEEATVVGLMDVFQLDKLRRQNQSQLQSGYRRLRRQQRKTEILQHYVFHQQKELSELSHLIKMVETQGAALRKEKDNMDTELQRTCDLMGSDVEQSARKHEPLIYKKYCAVKCSADAKSLLTTIRNRQRALHVLEAMTYRKFVALQHSLKIEAETKPDKDEKKKNGKQKSQLQPQQSPGGSPSPKKPRKVKDLASFCAASSGTATTTTTITTAPLLPLSPSLGHSSGSASTGAVATSSQQEQQQLPQQLQQLGQGRNVAVFSWPSTGNLAFEEVTETEV